MLKGINLMKKLVLILLIVLLTPVFPTFSQSETESRPYHLGFTPFPYDISQEAVDFVYDALETDADIIAHHFALFEVLVVGEAKLLGIMNEDRNKLLAGI